ncbi:PfkB family carbohydrate kinase [Streptococcus parauberis]
MMLGGCAFNVSIALKEMSIPLLPPVGAGDSHDCAFMVAYLNNQTIKEDLDFANYFASQVVANNGVSLSRETYQNLKQRLDC